MHITKPVDLAQLSTELDRAGVPHDGLGTVGPEGDAELFTYDAGGAVLDLPPEAVPVVAAHDARQKDRAAAFETAEDTERLRLVAERSRTDPAYAALAELALRGTP